MAEENKDYSQVQDAINNRISVMFMSPDDREKFKKEARDTLKDAEETYKDHDSSNNLNHENLNSESGELLKNSLDNQVTDSKREETNESSVKEMEESESQKLNELGEQTDGYNAKDKLSDENDIENNQFNDPDDQNHIDGDTHKSEVTEESIKDHQGNDDKSQDLMNEDDGFDQSETKNKEECILDNKEVDKPLEEAKSSYEHDDQEHQYEPHYSEDDAKSISIDEEEHRDISNISEDDGQHNDIDEHDKPTIHERELEDDLVEQSPLIDNDNTQDEYTSNGKTNSTNVESSKEESTHDNPIENNEEPTQAEENINDSDHNGNDMYHDENDVGNHEQDSHHDDQDLHHDDQDLYHDEEDPHHDEQDPNYADQDSHHDEQDSHHDEQDSHHDEQDSHHDEQDSHYDEQDSHYDEQDSHYDEQDSHHDEQDSHHDEQDSHHDEQGLNYDKKQTNQNHLENDKGEEDQVDEHDENDDIDRRSSTFAAASTAAAASLGAVPLVKNSVEKTENDTPDTVVKSENNNIKEEVDEAMKSHQDGIVHDHPENFACHDLECGTRTSHVSTRSSSTDKQKTETEAEPINDEKSGEPEQTNSTILDDMKTSGILYKQGKYIKSNWKKRFFIIDSNSTLSYTDINGKSRVKGCFRLGGNTKIHDISATRRIHGKTLYLFTLVDRDNRQILLATDSHKDKQRWINSITNI